MKRLAHAILAMALFVALFADCLAGDTPIVVSQSGEVSFFEDPIRLEDQSGERTTVLGPDDWALWPPLRFDPNAVRYQGRVEVLQEPSDLHCLGTDDRGRDVASRLLHGARLSVGLAIGCACLASVLGVFLALLATRRRWLDSLVLTSCDSIAAVPPLLAVLVVGGLVGGQSLWALVFLIAIPRSAVTARVVRDGLKAALAMPFCESARAVGCSSTRILLQHALPQCWGQIRVAAGLTAATAVLAEVALSFLGLTAAAAMPSWGELLRQAHENGLHWWLMIPAGCATAMLSWALGRISESTD